MKKWKIFTHLKDEENWINSIQKAGYQLENVNLYLGVYHFTPCPAHAISPVRIDYRSNFSKEAYQDYLGLYLDSGWKLISGHQTSGIQYFKKLQHASEDTLFSDQESQNAFYRRYRQNALTFAFVFLCYTVLYFQLANNQTYSIWNPKTLFLTPGLWQKEGIAFWSAFLFELPFAFFRSGLIFLIMFAGALFYLYIAYRAKPKK